MGDVISYAVVIILFLLLGCVMAVVISEEINYDKFMSQLWDLVFTTKQRKSTPRFDVSEYRKRREKLLLEIEQERQTEPKYHVTLWFGLRGLREQVDSKYKWVNRTPQNPTPEFTPKKNELSPAQLAYESFRNWQASQMVQSNQASIDDLRNRISNLQLQATQQELNQYAINTVCYPQYLRTNIYPVYKFNPACYVVHHVYQ